MVFDMNFSRIVKQICCVTLVAASASHASGKSSMMNNIVDKMYVKAGGGVMWEKKFKARPNTYQNTDPRLAPVFFAGAGYIFNSWLRTDLALQYIRTSYKISGNVLETASQRTDTTGVMLNGYYDINDSMFAPYITAGIGVGRNDVGKFRSVSSGNNQNLKGINATRFIWNAGAGVQLRVDENWAIDLGCRFMDLGKIEILASDNQKQSQRLSGNQAVAAFVYRF